MILRLLSLLAIFVVSISAAASLSITVYAWPLSASSPKPFAEITIPWTTDGIATVKSKKTVSAKDGELVRVGLLDSSKAWSGVATSSESFKQGITQKISLHTDGQGQVTHLSFNSFKSAKDDELLVDLLPIQAGPEPILNKPVVLNAEGKLDKPDVDERSFIQKYNSSRVSSCGLKLIPTLDIGGHSLCSWFCK
jgi:hypothetical protein